MSEKQFSSLEPGTPVALEDINVIFVVGKLLFRRLVLAKQQGTKFYSVLSDRKKDIDPNMEREMEEFYL